MGCGQSKAAAAAVVAHKDLGGDKGGAFLIDVVDGTTGMTKLGLVVFEVSPYVLFFSLSGCYFLPVHPAAKPVGRSHSPLSGSKTEATAASVKSSSLSNVHMLDEQRVVGGATGATTTSNNNNSNTKELCAPLTSGNMAKHQQQAASKSPSSTTTQQLSSSDPKTKTSEQRRAEFSVRKGYSSGASSFDGSMTDDDDASTDDFFKESDACMSERSRHSEILGLSDLRQEMISEGDLTKTVVRIESSFGQPIEEVYDGVSDGKVLGSGVSGIVRLITHKTTKVNYAVKILDMELIDSAEGLRALRNEIFIMCQLDHPNIVRIEEVYESTNEIYIVQELCLGGDLFDRLDEQPDYHYTEPQCARLVKQMLSGVRYLHSKGIIHRDLKLENFLFSSTQKDSELKMIDFGLSKHFTAGQHHHEKVGTPYTVAPEIIDGYYDERSDIWALGVITYLLLSGETPFGGLDGENPLVVKQNIQRAQVTFEPAEIWDSVSSDGIGFVKRLLQADPLFRPTAKAAQKDKWIQIWSKKDVKSGANKLNPKTVGALMAFKEQSDMQKLLSEVLSFTLLPEQIVELRAEFEKIDDDGDGEISLSAMKRVLLQNAEAGTLGALTEQEIESLFDAIRVRKSEPTIRWHEFLAAGLSQAHVDDRNLRLAFDRMDGQRKGYITLADLRDLLGNSTEANNLDKVWFESMIENRSTSNRITYEEFKRLMKGQSKTSNRGSARQSGSSLGLGGALGTVQEGEDAEMEFEPKMKPTPGKKLRSHSLEEKSPFWDPAELEAAAAEEEKLEQSGKSLFTALTEDLKENADSGSSMLSNRALYRRHRGMRMSVLEASKQFDLKRNQRNQKSQAGLIMKRGAKPPVELEDRHHRIIFEAAARRCGRATRTRHKHKTVSDISGMMGAGQ